MAKPRGPWRRAALVGAGAAAAAASTGAAYLRLAPGAIERGRNRVEVAETEPVAPSVRRLHASLDVVDLHADTLLWKRDLLTRSERGHVDLPRLRAGNVALQVFSSVTSVPRAHDYVSTAEGSDAITVLALAQAQPPPTWVSRRARALHHAEKLERFAHRSRGRLRIVRTSQDLGLLIADRRAGQDVTGAMLSLEGLHALEGDLDNLQRLYDAGYRMAGFTHFFDNEVAGSRHGVERGGLTELGRQALTAMESLGMVVDVAHVSRRAVADILATATRPVVSSHGGVRATSAVARNLTDEEVRGIAATGGLVGIGAWAGALGTATPEALAAAVAHVRDLVGIGHVGLGSDFDGSVTTGWDTARLDTITQALVDRGLSEEEVRAVMGGSALRVLGAGLQPRRG